MYSTARVTGPPSPASSTLDRRELRGRGGRVRQGGKGLGERTERAGGSARRACEKRQGRCGASSLKGVPVASLPPVAVPLKHDFVHSLRGGGGSGGGGAVRCGAVAQGQPLNSPHPSPPHSNTYTHPTLSCTPRSAPTGNPAQGLRAA